MTKSIKKTAASKNPIAAAAPDLQLHSLETLEAESAHDSMLNDLIASLDAPDEVIVESTMSAISIDTAMLAAAVSGAEATEVSVASASVTTLEAGSAPTGDASDVKPAAAATDKPKRVAVPRKRYTDKTERLKDKLGTDLAEYSVLTLADAGVTDTDLLAVMESTLVIIRGMSGKSQNWAVKFIEFMAGKKAAMSEVTGRILKLLQKDGFVSTGNTGNMYLDLVSKPYSPGAARAMGGNNLAMLMHLKVIQPDGKGRYVANPESLLLMKANSMLFAGSPEEAEEDAELGIVAAAVIAVKEAAVEAVVESVAAIKSAVATPEYEPALM